MAQIEQKQKRLNELEGLMSGLYEKQERLVNGLEDYATPPMSTTGATCDSTVATGSTETNDRIERIERLLVHGRLYLYLNTFLIRKFSVENPRTPRSCY